MKTLSLTIVSLFAIAAFANEPAKTAPPAATTAPAVHTADAKNPCEGKAGDELKKCEKEHKTKKH